MKTVSKSKELTTLFSQIEQLIDVCESMSADIDVNKNSVITYPRVDSIHKFVIDIHILCTSKFDMTISGEDSSKCK